MQAMFMDSLPWAAKEEVEDVAIKLRIELRIYSTRRGVG